MSDKVHGGTPKSGPNLCFSCRNGKAIAGYNGEQIVYCNIISAQVVFPVASCSEYDNRKMPSRWDMEEIAWKVTSRNRGPMGYTAGSVVEIRIEPPKPEDTE